MACNFFVVKVVAHKTSYSRSLTQNILLKITCNPSKVQMKDIMTPLNPEVQSRSTLQCPRCHAKVRKKHPATTFKAPSFWSMLNRSKPGHTALSAKARHTSCAKDSSAWKPSTVSTAWHQATNTHASIGGYGPGDTPSYTANNLKFSQTE